VGRAVRYAVHTEGVTWSRNAAVSSAPRPARPATAPAAASVIAHAAIRAAGRGPGRRRRRSMTASVPARSVADVDGTSAVQYRARVK
jgi:hypothetical protein